MAGSNKTEASAEGAPLPRPPDRVVVEEPAIKIYPFSIDKLEEDNARYWFHVIEKQLRLQYCWQAIQYYQDIGDREYTAVLERNVKWFRNDLKADSIIEHGLNPRTIFEVKMQPNAGRKWEYLKKRFLKKSNTRNALKLQRLANWTWDKSRHGKVREAFEEIVQMGEEFIELNGNSMIAIRELIILWFLQGLGDEYSTIRDTIMSSNATLEYDYVISQVEDIDHLRSKPTEKGSRAHHNGKGMRCFVCGKIGHKARNCSRKRDDDSDDAGTNDDKHRGGFKGQRGQKKKSNYQPKQKGISAEDHEDIGNISADEYEKYAAEIALRPEAIPKQALCARESHENLAKEANEGVRLSKNEIERAGFIGEECADRVNDGSTRWCFASGATSTSTGNREIFEFLNEKRNGHLAIANGNRLPIEGRGIVRFNLPNGTQVRLGSVIYVPGLAENLLSLVALHMAGVTSKGSKEGYELLKDGKVVARGRRTGRTTYLDSVTHKDALFIGPKLEVARQHARMALSADEKVRKRQELIHRRLGHPGRGRFNNCIEYMGLHELKIGKRDKLLHNNCEVCIKAKQVKKQNYNPAPRARRPLQRVYMDFWSLNREGMGDEGYFISLIDDCTRFSWIFIKMDRRTKSVLHTLDGWIRQVERQTGKMLLVIRTDNAKEFIALKPWAESKGIEIEFIEAETPPQNGVAERYNRIILEIARALLIDVGISRKYWKYAVVTANYLRNRTTLVSKSTDEGESASKDRTPYELWFGHQPDLSQLRAWGCRVLYYHRPDSKLESRVREGTFLMYGKSDKQYLVLPRGGSDLKLVTNPEFREQERGYLEIPIGTGNQPAPLTNINRSFAYRSDYSSLCRGGFPSSI